MTTPAPLCESGVAAMPSNDVRILLQAAVPTGCRRRCSRRRQRRGRRRQGAIGAVVGTLVVVLFMGLGLYILQRTAKSLPHLFQAMGLMLYAAQILLLFIFVAAFKNTTLFNPGPSRSPWSPAPSPGSPPRRAPLKSKILYVEPESSGEKPEKTGPLVVRGRAGIKRHVKSCYRPVPTAASRARASQLTPAQSRGEMPHSRPHTRNTSPVPNCGPAPRRHNEVAVPMRHDEGARGEC